ncbi:diguanylate cyclase [Candidatus Poribacteria bacterium]|nr:diguanylate cyclase [Candidatus Poribacteria bacterium]
MKKILYVEDSIFFASTVTDRFKNVKEYELVWTKNMAETIEILDKENGNSFYAAILDFELPDASNGEIIDVVVSKGIPSIVFTGYLDKEVRDIVWSKLVIDYVLKEDYQSMDYIISLLEHLDQNINNKVIVVDTSLSFCTIIADLLKVHRYKFFIVNDGNEALKLLEENPDTKIVITEYQINGLDGLALTHKIREKHTKDTLAIIGISAENQHLMAPRFLKYGANDFISKQSFTTEEFYRRITQNIENIEHIHTIKETAIRDYQTGLYNRKYFFEFAQKLIANVVRGNISVVCAILDIDNLQEINNTYGHNAGDIVIKKVSDILKDRMRSSDIIARLGGGEDFCIIAVNMKRENAEDVFKELCRKIENTPIETGTGVNIKVTISIGVCTKHKSSIDEFLAETSKCLKLAKKNGQNRMEIDI